MPLPVITVQQMRDWEAATWASGIRASDVIASAGLAVARKALELTRPQDRILILAGKGHNGDDARAAAAGLAGREVKVLDVLDPIAAVVAFPAHIRTRPALLIDGLFGIGLNRPLSSEWRNLLEQINQSGLPVLAIDIPSGLDADTGDTHGAALSAAVTLTLGAPKVGLLKAAAAPFVGRLEVAPDIGLVPCPAHSEMQWVEPADFADFPPRRPAHGHKGTFGHLGIVAGSRGYHGAAVLAARAASRAMPGLITLFTPEDVYVPVAAQLQNVMVRPGRPTIADLHQFSAVLLGPGIADERLAAELRDLVTEIWRNLDRPVIVDASALDWLTAGPTAARALRVITPHPGEAARLLQTTAREIQSDRPAALRSLAARLGGAHVALKGCHTLIGTATGPLYVNSSGNPGLAQGGSGDLLAGYLGGLLAQPALSAFPLTAIRYAVWQHGAAADDLNTRCKSWTLDDLLAILGNR